MAPPLEPQTAHVLLLPPTTSCECRPDTSLGRLSIARAIRAGFAPASLLLVAILVRLRLLLLLDLRLFVRCRGCLVNMVCSAVMLTRLKLMSCNVAIYCILVVRNIVMVGCGEPWFTQATVSCRSSPVLGKTEPSINGSLFGVDTS